MASVDQNSVHTITAKAAAYVVEKLIAARRISRKEVAQIIAEIGPEIRRLEARLAQLRAGSPLPSATASTSKVQQRKRAPTRKTAGGKALGGMYGGLIRRVPKNEQAQYVEIKNSRGIEAAIAALRARERT